ncbi:Pyridoxine 4-dehydrogenase [Aspergillus alliaceus]|uniref:Pyridoxine 4-dehydrogenase n=1 Tax=Petromyces alliaceus TaxID=209559 RepID=A0A8H5ZXP6_PETAA|nr:Pyridoxine 4-dehydrogenase [Aspergillus burnettii]
MRLSLHCYKSGHHQFRHSLILLGLWNVPSEPPTAGLWLLRRYFEKRPEDASKVALFIRACFIPTTLSPITTRDGIRASTEEHNRILGGVKKIDIFGPAMDRDVPIEGTLGALKELVSEGQIGAVGLLEVGAATIDPACACYVSRPGYRCRDFLLEHQDTYQRGGSRM